MDSGVGGRSALPYTSQALEQILAEFGVVMRWSVRSYRPEWRSADGDLVRGWTTWNDRLEGEIRESAAKAYCGLKADGTPTAEWSPTEAKWKIIWNSLIRRSECDPFMVWLSSLPVWDGSDRVESSLCDLLAAEDSELVRWASRAPFVGAIQRAFRPGAKNDNTPVLIGPQGGGKSAWAANLLPVPGWFGDHLTLDGTARDQAESLDGKVIVELSEMAGSRRADVQRIKTFLTRVDDDVRRAYARHTETSPRMCVFVGTANNSGSGVLPRDPTGSRRFVSILVGKASRAIEPALGELRDQLWAESLAKFHAGVDGWVDGNLPRSLIVDQKAANEPFESRDQTLDDRIATLPRKMWRMVDIAAEIGIMGQNRILPKLEQYRLADALSQAGWINTTRRVNGKPTKVWVPSADLMVVDEPKSDPMPSPAPLPTIQSLPAADDVF